MFTFSFGWWLSWRLIANRWHLMPRSTYKLWLLVYPAHHRSIFKPLFWMPIGFLSRGIHLSILTDPWCLTLWLSKKPYLVTSEATTVLRLVFSLFLIERASQMGATYIYSIERHGRLNSSDAARLSDWCWQCQLMKTIEVVCSQKWAA